MKSKSSTGQWWSAVAVAAVLALGGTFAVGCSDDEDEAENEDLPTPCETNEECAPDEMCDDEICIEAECLDEHEDVEEGEEIPCEEAEKCRDRRCVDDPLAIVEEEYFASFTSRVIAGDGDAGFHVVGSRDGSYAEIDVGDFDCGQARECTLTDDMEHIIVVDHSDSGSGFDAFVAPFDEENLEVSGDFEVFAEEVSNPRIRGAGIIYEVGSSAGHYRTIDGDDQELLPLAQQSDGWDFHAPSETVVYYWPSTLDSMDVYANQIGDDDFLRSGDSLAYLDGSNRPGDAGGYFQGTRPTGISDDGRFLAFTTYGPNNYNYCTGDEDCDQGIAHRCGTDDPPRCVAMEKAIHVIDLDYRDVMRQACTSHDDCGPVNRCDSGSEDFEGGICMPQRIVLGPSEVSQQNKTGCEWTREEATFTHINTPLTFGPDDQVYFVGFRDCTRSAADEDSQVENDIPRTAIVAGDPETGDFEEIYGNLDREDYAVSDCVDDPAGPECNHVIQDARLSPDGSDIIFRATVPTIGSPGQAHNAMDVWRVQRDGEDPEALGGMSQVETAINVAVHSIVEDEEDDNGENGNGEDDNGDDDNGEDDNGDDDNGEDEE